MTPEAVVVGSRDKQVHAFDPKTGRQIWTFTTKSRVDGLPVVVGDRLYVGSGDGRLYGLSAENGEAVLAIRGRRRDRRLGGRGRRPAGHRQRLRQPVLLWRKAKSTLATAYATSPSPCSTRSLCGRAPGRRRSSACRGGSRAPCRRRPWPGSRGRSSRDRSVPLMPKAALEITQVSRGRRVMRIGGSLRIALLDHGGGGSLVLGPGDDDVRTRLDFEQRHEECLSRSGGTEHTSIDRILRPPSARVNRTITTAGSQSPVVQAYPYGWLPSPGGGLPQTGYRGVNYTRVIPGRLFNNRATGHGLASSGCSRREQIMAKNYRTIGAWILAASS